MGRYNKPLNGRAEHIVHLRILVALYLATHLDMYNAGKDPVNDGRIGFSLDPELLNVAHKHNLGLDASRPYSNKALGSLTSAGLIGYVVTSKQGMLWFINEKGEQVVERLIEEMKSDKPVIPIIGLILREISANDFSEAQKQVRKKKSGLAVAPPSLIESNEEAVLALGIVYHVPALLIYQPSMIRQKNQTPNEVKSSGSGSIRKFSSAFGEKSLLIDIDNVNVRSLGLDYRSQEVGEYTSKLVSIKIATSEEVSDEKGERVQSLGMKGDSLAKLTLELIELGMIDPSSWWVKWLYDDLSERDRTELEEAIQKEIHGYKKHDKPVDSEPLLSEVHQTWLALAEILKPCVFPVYEEYPFATFRQSWMLRETTKNQINLAGECHIDKSRNWGVIQDEVCSFCEACGTIVKWSYEQIDSFTLSPMVKTQEELGIATTFLRELFTPSDLRKMLSFYFELEKNKVEAQQTFPHIRRPVYRTRGNLDVHVFGGYDLRYALKVLEESGFDPALLRNFKQKIALRVLWRWSGNQELESLRLISHRAAKLLASELKQLPELEGEEWFTWLLKTDETLTSYTEETVEITTAKGKTNVKRFRQSKVDNRLLSVSLKLDGEDAKAAFLLLRFCDTELEFAARNLQPQANSKEIEDYSHSNILLPINLSRLFDQMLKKNPTAEDLIHRIIALVGNLRTHGLVAVVVSPFTVVIGAWAVRSMARELLNLTPYKFLVLQFLRRWI